MASFTTMSDGTVEISTPVAQTQLSSDSVCGKVAASLVTVEAAPAKDVLTTEEV
jgi:hypothetical protein